MKLGILADFKKENDVYSIVHYDFLKKCGFDYFEFKLAQIANLSDDDFELFKSSLKDEIAIAKVCAYFFPSTIKLIGDLYNKEAFENYVNLAVKRASEVGFKILVLGSGMARVIPFGYDKTVGKKDFADRIKYITSVCEKYDVTLALEHLNRLETNMMDSFRESADFCCEINSDNFKIILDFYHFNLGNEDFALVEKNKDLIVHTHFATAMSRAMPHPLEIDDVMENLKYIKDIGYDEAMSMECRQYDFENEPQEYIDVITLIKERY